MYVHYNTTRALLRATVDKNTIMHILQHIEICANLFAKFQITFSTIATFMDTGKRQWLLYFFT